MAANPTYESFSPTSIGSTSLERSRLGAFKLPQLLDQWLRRARLRRDLERMDDRLLRDLGFDPALARAEAERPFWRRVALERSLVG
jgi:uncharacterized protein YjiS (DUF1127 family)